MISVIVFLTGLYYKRKERITRKEKSVETSRNYSELAIEHKVLIRLFRRLYNDIYNEESPNCPLCGGYRKCKEEDCEWNEMRLMFQVTNKEEV